MSAGACLRSPFVGAARGFHRVGRLALLVARLNLAVAAVTQLSTAPGAGSAVDHIWHRGSKSPLVIPAFPSSVDAGDAVPYLGITCPRL